MGVWGEWGNGGRQRPARRGSAPYEPKYFAARVSTCRICSAGITRAKGGIVRYGGMSTYLRLRPLFFGLILGEFSQAVLWATISAIWRAPVLFFPRP